MGEEEKKVEEKKVEEKKVEEVKKTEEVGEKKEEAKAEKEKSSDEAPPAKVEEPPKEAPTPTPPPPPQEIVLKVYMHCEGCARKVRRCLKGFEGVEDVKTDCKTHKVVVKGEKADPLKVLGRVQRKSHRQVELISPIPPPPEPKKPEEKEIPKPPEKKEEPVVITVVLKVHMHCEACAEEIKKRIERMKGVENATPDLKASEVKVKGVFEAAKLVEHVYKRTGKHAIVVKQEPEKKEEVKENESKEEKKVDEGGEKKAEEAPAAAEGGEEAKKEEGGEKKEEAKADEAVAPAPAEGGKEETKGEVMEVKKNEFYYYYPPQNYQVYPPRVATEMYSYPPAPQIFSDENPNACSVM